MGLATYVQGFEVSRSVFIDESTGLKSEVFLEKTRAPGETLTAERYFSVEALVISDEVWVLMKQGYNLADSVEGKRASLKPTLSRHPIPFPNSTAGVKAANQVITDYASAIASVLSLGASPLAERGDGDEPVVAV